MLLLGLLVPFVLALMAFGLDALENVLFPREPASGSGHVPHAAPSHAPPERSPSTR